MNNVNVVISHTPIWRYKNIDMGVRKDVKVVIELLDGVLVYNSNYVERKVSRDESDHIIR
jgi:hypothetical protein